MSALYVNITPEIWGIMNDVAFGVYQSTPEEWKKFFEEGNSKWDFPPGESIGGVSEFNSEWRARRAPKCQPEEVGTRDVHHWGYDLNNNEIKITEVGMRYVSPYTLEEILYWSQSYSSF